jgi:SAM-dependent methyltransferase
MILKALHRVASYGPVYDMIQIVCGVKLIDRRVRRLLEGYPGYRNVLDIGGGTGRVRSQLSSECRYYCLDNEAPKLRQLRRTTKDAFAILGDATKSPIAAASMDLVLCVAVSHHLSDSEFQQVLVEITRILKPGGRLMFHDPLWNRYWLPGRILWWLDRGSNPRSKEALLAILNKHVEIIRQEEFRIAHKYLLLLASRNEVPG